MSGAVDAVVLANPQVLLAANPAAYAAAGAAGGVLLGGAAVYFAARQMNKDFTAAMEAYNTRAEREAAAFAQQNAAYLAAQSQAKAMSLTLGEQALADPNVAFLLGNLNRLKIRAGGNPNDGPAGDGGGAALRREIDALIQSAARGEATQNLAAYQNVAQKVAQFAARKSAFAGDKNAATRAFVSEELALLKEELRHSQLSTRRFGQKREMIAARISEVEKLLESQPQMAAQALELLQTRARGEMREAAQNAKTEFESAARLRQIVGEISSNAQAVVSQTVLEAPREAARGLLKQLSALVAASPIELSAVEALRAQSCDLFLETQKQLDAKATEQMLEEQVAQVLGGLGYNVTRATSGDNTTEKMVAVLDSSIGVQLNIDGAGNLNGQMVAFSNADAQFSQAQQERVCDLMDAIFDGLRARNLVVRERKRKNLKPENGVLEVVKRVENSEATSGSASVELKAMRLG